MKKKSDFYKDLRAKVNGWVKARTKRHRFAEYILVGPDLFHLLCKLSIDKDVPAEQKAKLAAALAYFVSPVDLIPEGLLGPVGYLDDVALAAYVLNSVVNATDAAIVRRHWAGDGDVLDVIKKILEVADDMIGSGLWATLRKTVDRVAPGRARAGGKGRSRTRAR